MEKTAEDFTLKQYEYALSEFKNLQTGRIIRCAALYDTLDKNATQCNPSKKGKYKNCYFVVVKGPTYIGDKCVSNAIVLKINSKQEKDYEYIFYKKGVATSCNSSYSSIFILLLCGLLSQLLFTLTFFLSFLYSLIVLTIINPLDNIYYKNY